MWYPDESRIDASERADSLVESGSVMRGASLFF
jgi:hypothetical protein